MSKIKIKITTKPTTRVDARTSTLSPLDLLGSLFTGVVASFDSLKNVEVDDWCKYEDDNVLRSYSEDNLSNKVVLMVRSVLKEWDVADDGLSELNIRSMLVHVLVGDVSIVVTSGPINVKIGTYLFHDTYYVVKHIN